jgi:hypothetical protein
MGKGNDISREQLVFLITKVAQSQEKWTVDDIFYAWEKDSALSRGFFMRFVGPTLRRLQKLDKIKLTPEWKKSARHSKPLPVWTKY